VSKKYDIWKFLRVLEKKTPQIIFSKNIVGESMYNKESDNYYQT